MMGGEWSYPNVKSYACTPGENFITIVPVAKNLEPKNPRSLETTTEVQHREGSQKPTYSVRASPG